MIASLTSCTWPLITDMISSMRFFVSSRDMSPLRKRSHICFALVIISWRGFCALRSFCSTFCSLCEPMSDPTSMRMSYAILTFLRYHSFASWKIHSRLLGCLFVLLLLSPWFVLCKKMFEGKFPFPRNFKATVIPANGFGTRKTARRAKNRERGKIKAFPKVPKIRHHT